MIYQRFISLKRCDKIKMKRFIFVLGILIWLIGGVSASYCLTDQDCGPLQKCRNLQCELDYELIGTTMQGLAVIFAIILIYWFIDSIRKDREKQKLENRINKLEEKNHSEKRRIVKSEKKKEFLNSGRTDDIIDFDDFKRGWCDAAFDKSKRQVLFDKYKGKYIIATGEIYGLDKSSDGSVKMMKVKLCPSTITWDIEVKPKENQQSNLLRLKEGDKVTFIAKLMWFPELCADDGEIIF